ncbi:MAG TPA: NAD(P)H-hydrate dehydratase [bacterium]|nr:NAD(P)H-hydrate dehydratase [bacterium]
MRRLLTAAQMRESDRRTIEEVGIPGLLLMENAGLGIVGLVSSILKDVPSPRILILCGRGNNGGDGLVAARHLINRGYAVDVRLAGDPDSLRGDALQNYRMLTGMSVPVHSLLRASQLPKPPGPDLIVDALLGTGVAGPVTGLISEIIRWINDRSCPVISVDIPSGLQADNGRFEGACVRADYTATMAELKVGLALPPGRDLAGKITIVDIGSPPSVAAGLPVQTHLLEQEDILHFIPPRPPDGHKGTFGKILVLAGSRGMTGAAALCALSSLRAGAGLTKLGIPESLNAILEAKCTEVITHPLPDTGSGCLAEAAEPETDALASWADVLIVGPGLSLHPETVVLTRSLLRKKRRPLVLDADGINALEGEASLLGKYKKPLILTPHPGELARLTGRSLSSICEDPIAAARETARDLGCVCVLKGSPAVIASPRGKVAVNSTGNSGLATGGTGDVLAGVIGGLLALCPDPFRAACAGVYLHGLAGDLAAEALGEHSLIAGDLLDALPRAFLKLNRS